MLETEIKLPIDLPASARSRLRNAGFRLHKRRIFEVNIVLDTPDLSLKSSGRLLRLRQAGRTSTLTVKGLARDGRHKSRPEFETQVSDFDSALTIFENLGYRPMFRYEKFRTEFAGPAGKGVATVDETPIGCFLELEGPGSWIDAAARRLGFARRDYITASYGALYLDYCRERGIPPRHMVFP